jgi:hypothetical protein
VISADGAVFEVDVEAVDRSSSECINWFLSDPHQETIAVTFTGGSADGGTGDAAL